MDRPLYETSKDITNELRAIKRIVGDREIYKLHPKYGPDFCVIKDGIITSWVEVKCRTFASTKFDTTMIDVSKMTKSFFLSEKTGKPFILIVEWTDKIGYFVIKTLENIEIRLGGRKDRNDPLDIEPYYYIPVTWFKLKEIVNED